MKINWSQDWCLTHCPRLENHRMCVNGDSGFVTPEGVKFGLSGHPACVLIEFADLTKTQKALIEYDCRHDGIIDTLEKWADWERDCESCPLYQERLPKIEGGDTVFLF